MYGHFPHDGLTRGRIRDRIIKKNMECQFHIEQKLQSRRKCIPANISGCLDTIFCQDRPAWIERSAWILISWSARKGCESVCPDRCFCLDARIDLPGYCQDTIHHPVDPLECINHSLKYSMLVCLSQIGPRPKSDLP